MQPEAAPENKTALFMALLGSEKHNPASVLFFTSSPPHTLLSYQLLPALVNQLQHLHFLYMYWVPFVLTINRHQHSWPFWLGLRCIKLLTYFFSSQLKRNTVFFTISSNVHMARTKCNLNLPRLSCIEILFVSRQLLWKIYWSMVISSVKKVFRSPMMSYAEILIEAWLQ